MRILVVLVVVLLPVACWAEKVALVIANSAYMHVSPLVNPGNDGNEVSKELEKQGFEVTLAQDQDRTQFLEVLRDFRSKADASNIALVYYAGHGIEIAGRNYLIPIDALVADERDAQLEMIELQDILSQISGARRMKMVVLDACRDNPFVHQMKQTNAGRNVGRGLAVVTSAEADTLIAYAAAAGDVTPDGEAGGNSPFTSAFLQAMRSAPTDVRLLLGDVRDTMRKSVPSAAPFVYSSLGGGEYVINPLGNASSTIPSESVDVDPNRNSTVEDVEQLIIEFATAELQGTPTGWQEFLKKHENLNQHPLYVLALRSLATLEQEKTPSDENTAERVVTVKPSIEASPEQLDNNLKQLAIEPTLGRREAIREIQRELKERNCYQGTIDGLYGPLTRRGLAALGQRTSTYLDLSDISTDGKINQVLSQLRAIKGGDCPKVAAAQSKNQSSVKNKPSNKTVVSTPTPSTVEKDEDGSVFSNPPNYCPVYGRTANCLDGKPIDN